MTGGFVFQAGVPGSGGLLSACLFQETILPGDDSLGIQLNVSRQEGTEFFTTEMGGAHPAVCMIKNILNFRCNCCRICLLIVSGKILVNLYQVYQSADAVRMCRNRAEMREIEIFRV